MLRRLIRGFCTINLDEKLSKGILTICPTPIGNLQDWTPRQDLALFGADVVACEDTRVTGFLLKMLRQRKDEKNHKDEKDIDEDDMEVQDIVFSSSKDLAIKLPELNKEFITEQDFKFYKQKRIDEMNQRLKLAEQKQHEYLQENDPLNFMGKQQEDLHTMTEEEFEIYGITAPFMVYLKNKIAVAKEKKGRGILISCHKFNEEARINRLIAMLKLGLNITLVSEAGTPTISDPGYNLISKCIERNIQIISLPGASAITVALSLCGFPADQFQFFGFSSKTLHEREQTLEIAKRSGQTAVFFESANRLNQLLLSIEKVYGEHQFLWIGFELTKMFEKKLRGRCRELYEDLTNPTILKASHLKGEVTVIIAPYKPQYNDYLKALEINQSEKNPELESEENSSLLRQVDSQLLAKLLCEKVPQQDLSQILQTTLKISKSQSMKLIFEAKHEHRDSERRKKLRNQLGINIIQ